MASPLNRELEGNVLLLGLSNPPVNAVSAALREALLDAITEAEDDADVHQIVLLGEGRHFCAGADITEFDGPMSRPSLGEVCNRIEACKKPVVAAIHGVALGGGFELALAAHYRIAQKGARIGLPEVALGVLPGAGGTQRLPRLTGAGPALALMTSGRPVLVSTKGFSAVFDDIIDGDLTRAAIAFARQLGVTGRGPRPTRHRREGLEDPALFATDVAKARGAAKKRHENAIAEIATAVEMAQLTPFDVGLAFEEDAFFRLLNSDQSRAMRHIFFAERRAAKLPLAVASRELPQIARIAVLGAGSLAGELVLHALGSGLSVAWAVRDAGNLRDGIARLDAMLDQAVASGRISPERKKELLGRLAAGRAEDVLPGCQMALIAAPGQTGIPLPSGCVRLTAIGDQMRGVGMRFARPVVSNPLVEVIETPDATGDDIVAASALAARLRKRPVYIRSTGTGLLSRLLRTCDRAADALVDLGANPFDIDRAIMDWGWPRASFLARDRSGLVDAARAARADGAHNWAQILNEARPAVQGKPRGFYAYPEGRPSADPETLRIIDGVRGMGRLGAADDVTLMDLILAAMANEGLRAVADGMARQASDIDVALVLGSGFPRWRGGPMKAASLRGLLTLSRQMADIDHPDHALWTVSPEWQKAIREGVGIDTL